MKTTGKILFLFLTVFAAINLAGTTVCLAGPGDNSGGNSNTDNSTPLFQVANPQVQPGQPSKIMLVSQLPGAKTAEDWQTIMANVIKLVLAITGSLAFAAFTYGGVMMISAQGNEDQIRKGKNILFYSVLALTIIAASYAIVIGITQLKFFQ